MPSESVSIVSEASSGKASESSLTPSLSSSRSVLLPMPSESVSTVSEASSGEVSASSTTPSPSVSVYSAQSSQPGALSIVDCSVSEVPSA